VRTFLKSSFGANPRNLTWISVTFCPIATKFGQNIAQLSLLDKFILDLL